MAKKDDRLWSQEVPDRLMILYHGRGKVVGKVWLDDKGALHFSGDMAETCRNLYRSLQRMIEIYPLNVGRVLGGKGKEESRHKI